jgi:hypothetical protein
MDSELLHRNHGHGGLKHWNHGAWIDERGQDETVQDLRLHQDFADGKEEPSKIIKYDPI